MCFVHRWGSVSSIPPGAVSRGTKFLPVPCTCRPGPRGDALCGAVSPAQPAMPRERAGSGAGGPPAHPRAPPPTQQSAQTHTGSMVRQLRPGCRQGQRGGWRGAGRDGDRIGLFFMRFCLRMCRFFSYLLAWSLGTSAWIVSTKQFMMKRHCLS